MTAAFPANADRVRVRWYDYDQDGGGSGIVTTFTPTATRLTDLGAFGYVRPKTRTATPDPTTAYAVVDLLATNHPDLTPFAYTVTPTGYPTFTVRVDVDAPVVDVGGGVLMKALWLPDLPTTATPPAPVSSFYTAAQTDAAIVNALNSTGTAASRLTRTATAATALSGHRVVTPNPDGTLRYASASTPGDARRPMWLTLHAADAGAACTVLLVGDETESSWSWTPGAPLYLGATGLLTSALPTAPQFLAELAVAISPTRITFDRRPSVQLTA